MGLDARMYFKVSTPLSEETLSNLNYNLGGAFKESFFFYNDTNRPIEVDQDKINTYNLNLCGRYYGPSYERGDCVSLIAIAEWLEFNIPGCLVYYGGDSSDELSFFSVVERLHLKLHFFQVGHFPYQCSDLRGPKHNCPRCKKVMYSCGGGGDREFLFCYGCPNKAIACGEHILHLKEIKDFFEASQKLDSRELQFP